MTLKSQKAYSRAIDLNLVKLEPWFLLNKNQIEQRQKGLSERFPSRKLIPFAKRDDNDDVACFEEGKGDEVQIIHDFAAPGFEQRQTFSDFWEWFKYAIDEMISFE